MSILNPEDNSFDPTTSPPVPITDEELRYCIIAMRRDLRSIKIAVIGEPKLGIPGAIQRLADVEMLAKKSDQKLLVWGSILSAAGVFLVFIKDMFNIHKP